MKTCAECKWFAKATGKEMIGTCYYEPRCQCRDDDGMACSHFEPIEKAAPIPEPLIWLILESNNRCLWLTNNFDLGCKNPSHPYNDDRDTAPPNAGRNGCRMKLCPILATHAYREQVRGVTEPDDDKGAA